MRLLFSFFEHDVQRIVIAQPTVMVTICTALSTGSLSYDALPPLSNIWMDSELHKRSVKTKHKQLKLNNFKLNSIHLQRKGKRHS